jgi:hypothetical protein
MPPESLVDRGVAPANVARSLQEAHKQKFTVFVEDALCFGGISTSRLLLLRVLRSQHTALHA